MYLYMCACMSIQQIPDNRPTYCTYCICVYHTHSYFRIIRHLHFLDILWSCTFILKRKNCNCNCINLYTIPLTTKRKHVVENVSPGFRQFILFFLTDSLKLHQLGREVSVNCRVCPQMFYGIQDSRSIQLQVTVILKGEPSLWLLAL